MKNDKARRYNKGKLRYELISSIALKEIAKVYTKGAEKYTVRDDDGNIVSDGANNWRKGQSWMGCIGSAKRHIESFVNNTDFDPETDTYHLANACFNLMAILDFYKTYPQGDDRPKPFLNQPKIGLDIDCVIADFVKAYSDLYDDVDTEPTSWYMDRNMRKRFAEMRENGVLDKFYLSIPPMINVDDIPFDVSCYITSRPVSTEVTQRWLDMHGFPRAKVYTVDLLKTKVDVAKEAGIDIFIDDSFDNFVDLNNNNIFTYLFTQPWNKKYDVGHMRIDSLKDLKFNY
ncbi:MAG: dATP/dGTP diphosphohydrolase domain-containing protein [bacterium]